MIWNLLKIGSRGLHVATSVGRKEIKKQKYKANLNGKPLNCLVPQPTENRPLRGHEVAKPMEVYSASRVLIFKPFVFRSISMAVLGDR